MLLYQMAILESLADGLVLYSFRLGGWDDFAAARLDQAVGLFRHVERLGAIGHLRRFYDDLLVQHRDEMLKKLALEKRLQQIQRDRNEATIRGDESLTGSLTREITQLHDELNNTIDVWTMITSFIELVDRGGY
jgi:hypothetical protein